MLERLQNIGERDNSLLTKIYEVAHIAQIEHPYDAAHDSFHHDAVLLNGLEIIEREGIAGQIDIPVFGAAAMYHDLERKSKTHDLAVLKMRESGLSEDFTDKVVNLINEHSFEDKQTTLAGKVLWAADKIEYVSKDRFMHSLENLSELQMIFYRKILNARIKKVREKFKNLGLKSAEDMFLNKFEELKSFVKKEKPEYSAWLKSL
jgi:hypothetical protein